jgi:hypothetical protein
MKYCSHTTSTHAIAVSYGTVLIELNTLIARESLVPTSPLFDSGTLVIDLDLAEEIAAKTARRLPNSSMDMAIGLMDSVTKTSTMLLVEIRLNYTNPNNLVRSKLDAKVSGSKYILSNMPPIAPEIIFIFATNYVQQAINRLFRMVPMVNSPFKVMDVNQLKATYF